jgi:hypothetical protein
MKRNKINSFLIGASIHLLLWALVINFDSTKFDFACGETSCYTLAVMDLPISLLFISGSNVTVTYSSFVLGSIWWGSILLFIHFILDRLQKSA